MSDRYLHTAALMGTVVTIEIVGEAAREQRRDELAATVEHAVGWFREIEAACTRFDEQSELRRLSARVGSAVPVSTLLFRLVEFAVRVAEETGGAFDPTVGRTMAARGFNRHYRGGPGVVTAPPDGTVSYRDVRLDAARQAITLLRPLDLDLGAVAKGFAVDMAARELEPCANFSINAGGDVRVLGHNAAGLPWRIGIRDPRTAGEIIAVVALEAGAICTSGDYERTNAAGDAHILDPRSGETAAQLASVSVLAPTAMLADALATAAFVLGPDEGRALLESCEVEGLFITRDMEKFATRRWPGE